MSAIKRWTEDTVFTTHCNYCIIDLSTLKKRKPVVYSTPNPTTNEPMDVVFCSKECKSIWVMDRLKLPWTCSKCGSETVCVEEYTQGFSIFEVNKQTLGERDYYDTYAVRASCARCNRKLPLNECRRIGLAMHKVTVKPVLVKSQKSIKNDIKNSLFSIIKTFRH